MSHVPTPAATPPTTTLAVTGGPANAIPGGLASATASPASHVAPGTVMRFVYADIADDVALDKVYVTYDPRAHDLVATDLKRFAYVVLKTVTITIVQTKVSGVAYDELTDAFPLKVGVMPRGLCTWYTAADPSTKAKVIDWEQTRKLVGRVPHLRMMVLNTTVATIASFTWGDGGIPFPPGVQLDLKAGELRFPYAQFVVASLNANGSGKATGTVSIEFECECSGANFGR
jgi:hypothetical protein